MNNTEIQKRFDVIQKKYYHIKGYLVQTKLDKDGYIETNKNDKEVKEFMEMFEDLKSLIRDIASYLPSNQSDEHTT